MIIETFLNDIMKLPDHNDLPCEDGVPKETFLEHPQAMLLSETIRPVLRELHPDGQFIIGNDSGIYWRMADPPLKGAVAPDWFYIPHVPPKIDGKGRRSYVMWQEMERPALVIEFSSRDGSAERDRTPNTGKFWIYERKIEATYYAIYEVEKAFVEVYRLELGRYRKMEPNQRGHYPIPEIGIDLGIWRGLYTNVEFAWLRAWDVDGELLQTWEEKDQIPRRQSEIEWLRAEQEKQRADKLAVQLKAMGIDPDA